MFMRKSTQLIISALLAVSIAVFWLAGVEEEKSIQRDSASKLDSEELIVRRMESDSGKTQRMVEDYRNNLKEMSQFKKTFLENKDVRIVRISEFLEERARARRVKLEQVQYNSSRGKQSDLDLYVAQLPLTGRYRDIRSFIDDIETSGMFLIITELSLEDDSAGEGVVEMQLSLATYFEGSHE